MKKLRMKPHGEKGLLFTFCGLDGCGKSSMIGRLQEALAAEGHELVLIKQPTPAFRGTDIFRTYMDAEDPSQYDYRALSLAAAADRIQHAWQVILPALREGKVVIADRYVYSCLANLRARGYTKDRWLYEIAEALPKPDLAFFLDLPVETAVARVRSRPEERDHYIDMPLQYRLREEYRSICKKNGGSLVPSDGSIEEAFATVQAYVKKQLGGKQ
ncbi:MAG: dTMP kinase [Clostridia bacterium]|nr:dTMP kinase [Clostridia bacterium]